MNVFALNLVYILSAALIKAVVKGYNVQSFTAAIVACSMNNAEKA